MKLFSGKRGDVELQFSALSPLIIVFLVFIILLVYVGAVGSSTYFEREFLTSDIGLMIEALQAAPYNAQVNYPSDNSEKAKKLKIIINKNFVEAHNYDINPKIAPSKTSRYNIIPSSIDVIETSMSPRIEKDTNGGDIAFSYRLYFYKTQDEISASMDQKNSPLEENSGVMKNIIDTFVDNWYENQKVYIDLMYNKGAATGTKVDGEVLLTNICRYLDITVRDGVYSLNDCTYRLTLSIEERIKAAEKADLVVILYVNEKKPDSDTIDVYTLNQGGDLSAKSEKLAALSLKTLEESTIYNSKSGKLEDPLRSDVLKIASGKPAIVVEIGYLQNPENKDVDSLGRAILGAIDTYYSK